MIKYIDEDIIYNFLKAIECASAHDSKAISRSLLFALFSRAGLSVTAFPFASNVEKVKYDFDTKILYVSFKGSSDVTYAYKDVPVEAYIALMRSESVGSFLGKSIKPAHEFAKLESCIEKAELLMESDTASNGLDVSTSS